MKKLLVSAIVLILFTYGWGTSISGEEVPMPRGEVRIVDTHPLNWGLITMTVFEHLIEVNNEGKLVPHLATDWRWLNDRTIEFTLRQRVKFHNGEVFDAEIVKLNWEDNFRTRQPHIVGRFMNFKPGSRVEIIDPYTVRFIFPEPDGAALTKFTLLHIGNRQFYRELGWGEKHW